MMSSLDTDTLRGYNKIQVQIYNTLWTFFNHHLELLFLKLDHGLIANLIKLVEGGMGEVTFEVQSDACNCLNAFSEYVHDKLKCKPTQKSAYLASRV